MNGALSGTWGAVVVLVLAAVAFGVLMVRAIGTRPRDWLLVGIYAACMVVAVWAMAAVAAMLEAGARAVLP